MPIEKLPFAARTLYAELLEQLFALHAKRSLGHLSGSFVTKIIKDEAYYYFQYSEPGGIHRQVYLGKRTSALDRLVERFKAEKALLEPDLQHLRQLCAQLRAGGMLVTDGPSARVLKALADGGVFQLQGVLVGTHAFTVLGNLLGVHWKRAAVKTADIDVAGKATLEVALPTEQADVPQILEDLQMGFLPVPAFHHKNPSTSFKIRGQALRVDFLTPGAVGKQPVKIARFNVFAQTLPYLDYLIEYPEKGAVLGGEAILVNVPMPARFALHKILLSQERALIAHDKIEKDLHQAAQIIDVLSEERPGDLEMAWEALKQRGAGWVKKFMAGWKQVARIWPEAGQHWRVVG